MKISKVILTEKNDNKNTFLTINLLSIIYYKYAIYVAWQALSLPISEMLVC